MVNGFTKKEYCPKKTFFEVGRADICLIIDENDPNKFFKNISKLT